MRAQVANLIKVNNLAIKRRARKKKQLQIKGALSKGNSSNIIAIIGISVSNQAESTHSTVQVARVLRRCRGCGEPRHNIQTCLNTKVDTLDTIESSNLE